MSKKNKTKWVSVDPSSLIETGVRKATNWADEVDDSTTYIDPARIKKVELPTAPKSSRATGIDDSKIPTEPPYQAYVSNIPYDLNEDELKDHFQNLKVKNVKLPKDDKGSRAKGFGYVEFEDRANLVAALQMADATLKGRHIKIELPHNDVRRDGRGMRGIRDRDQSSTDRTSGNWRSGPRQDDYEDRGGYDRGGGFGGRRDYGGGSGGSGFSRGGFDREERGSFQREDRGDRFDRGGGREERGGGFRERGGFDRGGERGGGRERDGAFSNFNDRGGGGGFRERIRDDGFPARSDDRGGSWRDDMPKREERREERRDDSMRDRDRGFGGRGGFDDRRERDRDRGFGGPPPRRDDPPPRRDDPLPNPEKGGDSRRPKLQLKPRSVAKESEDSTAAASASIFGGAKPVDTAAREREIEQRLMKNTDEVESYRGKSGPGSVGSGRSGGDREEKEKERKWEAPERRVEPAPPPKENAWSRKAVSNGRSSPDDERSRASVQTDEHNRDDSKSRKSGDERRGVGPRGQIRDKSRGKEPEKHSKHRERKESIDDISKMPKLSEAEAPNFAGSNIYSALVDSDDAQNE